MKNDPEYKAKIQNFPGKVCFILPAFGKYRIVQNFDGGKVTTRFFVHENF